MLKTVLAEVAYKGLLRQLVWRIRAFSVILCYINVLQDIGPCVACAIFLA